MGANLKEKGYLRPNIRKQAVKISAAIGVSHDFYASISRSFVQSCNSCEKGILLGVQ